MCIQAQLTNILGGDESINAIKENVRIPNNAKILDVGSNGGMLSFVLADIYGASVTSVDKDVYKTELGVHYKKNLSLNGDVRFSTIDIMNEPPEFSNQFDLVVHRGLEAFVEDKEKFRRILFKCCKDWGWIVNISHHYESTADQKIIDSINKRAGTHIVASSRRDIISSYTDLGLDYIDDYPVPVDGTFTGIRGTSGLEVDQELLKLVIENDMLTSASVFIFRKPLAVYEMLQDKQCKA